MFRLPANSVPSISIADCGIVCFEEVQDSEGRFYKDGGIWRCEGASVKRPENFNKSVI